MALEEGGPFSTICDRTISEYITAKKKKVGVGTRFSVPLQSRGKETGHVPGIPVCTAGPLDKVKGCTSNWLFAAAGIHSLGGGGSSGSGGGGGGGRACSSGGGGGGGCLAP